MNLSYFKNIIHNTRSGFTLLELVVVIGIVAILGTVSVLVLNPAQIFKQTRDAGRITDLQNINQALVYYRASGGSSFGSTNTIYVSLPDSSATCANIGLPTPPSGWSYACKPAASYQSADGTGWIPVNFSAVQQTVGTLFTALPIDPVNTLLGDYYYTYIVGSWTLSATMESTKYINSSAVNDGGVVSTRFETGNELALNSNITSGGGLSSAKAIAGFSFASPAATGVITGTNIAVTVPNGTNVTALVPTITISALASVSPNTGVAQNFTSPVTYTVTAQNGTTQAYVVTVTVSPPPLSATGGTITTSGGYTIHTFTTSGTFTVTGSGDVEVLVVAGGGGGGATIGGGGGGGGLIYNSALAVTAQAYSVTVGNGGGGGPAPYDAGLKGGNSVFSTLTAIGGGGGASYSTSPVGTGGSAGGNGAVGIRAGYTAGQGNDGGAGDGAGSYGGGGGGAGAAGSAATVGASAGNGGAGSAYSISGVSTYYAGGGGGGARWSSGGPAGTGGNGGGGNGRTDAAGNAGTVNTGGGGGAGGYTTEKAGGAGGSGIVIVRYLTP